MNNIHDKLFKQMMSLKSEAIALAKSFFPKDVLDKIDLDTFELSNVSFINEQLKEYFADIVYTCRTKENKEVKISFLLEHKSYTDPHLPLQLLRYLVEGYDYQYVKEGKKELSLIIPVLVYHGDSKWESREVIDMIPLSSGVLGRYVPNFSYDVIDLVSTTDEYLKNMRLGHLLPATFILFKHKGDKAYFLENMREIHIFVKRTVTKAERDLFVESVRNYVFGFFQISKQENMAYDNMLREVIEEKLYMPGSTIDTTLQQGRAEGMVKGMVMNNLAVSLNLLKSLPDLSNLQIASLAKAQEQFVADIKEIVTKNTSAQAKKMIMKKFFKDIKLDKKQEKEVMKDIVNYYKKE